MRTGQLRGKPDARARGLAIAAICAGVLVACGGVEPRPQPLQDFRRLEADLGVVWEAATRTLIDRGYDIQTLDRSAWVIETGWLTVNPDFTATIFVTEWEDRYATCGRPALGQVLRAKQARLVLTLSPMGRGETGLRVEASFRTERYSGAPLWYNQWLGHAGCSSRGRLEEEIKVQVQLRVFSDQLERLRRGAP
jgi:hypothetical protein